MPAQQLAAAKSAAEALKTDRDQLAEVVLEMQVSGAGVLTAAVNMLARSRAAVSKQGAIVEQGQAASSTIQVKCLTMRTCELL